MKKILLLLSVVLMSASVNAQEPDFNVAPDFTVTDINGTTHNLYTYLDQGKTVVIDLFATWCAPCWNYSGHPSSSTHANFGALEDFYTAYGPNGTNEVIVLSIEADASTPLSDLYGGGTSQGDWVTGTPYPVIDDASVAPLFNLAYYPTIVMVCPDRYAYEIGQESLTALYAAVGNCPSVPTLANDPRVLGENSDPIFCSGDDATMRVVVQNYGTTTLSSMTIEVLDGTNSVLTSNWTGSLAMYEAEEVVLGTVSPSGATNYTIKITSSNDDTSNDDASSAVTPAPVVTVNPANRQVVIEVMFDGYASEFGYVFDAGMPIVEDYVSIYNDANAGTTSPLAFTAMGTYADGLASISDTILTTTDGCHSVLFVDGYGDGLTYPSNGEINIFGLATGSTPVSVNPVYEDHIFGIFEVQAALGVVELENIDSKLYPNPVKNQNATLELNDVQGNVNIRLTDVTGKVISNMTVNSNGRVMLPTQNLESGVYIVSISTETGSAIERIIVE